jgi:hypothetical protein
MRFVLRGWPLTFGVQVCSGGVSPAHTSFFACSRKRSLMAGIGRAPISFRKPQADRQTVPLLPLALWQLRIASQVVVAAGPTPTEALAGACWRGA